MQRSARAAAIGIRELLVQIPWGGLCDSSMMIKSLEKDTIKKYGEAHAEVNAINAV